MPQSIFAHLYKEQLGFSGRSAGKESACNAGDLGLIPGLGSCPGEGNGYPLQYSLYSPWGRKELDTTEWLSLLLKSSWAVEGLWMDHCSGHHMGKTDDLLSNTHDLNHITTFRFYVGDEWEINQTTEKKKRFPYETSIA